MSGLQDQRVFLVTAAPATTDISTEVNSQETGSAALSMTADVDYLYIASVLPFNHKYFNISTVNATTAVMQAEHWWGNEWKSFIDQIDNTSLSGASAGQSGVAHWTIDDQFGWDYEDYSDDLTGFTKTGIYKKYWVRISFSASITFTLNYIGQLFSNDTLLYQKYPQLNSSRMKTAFASGKTDWLDQHIGAAEEIVHDLRTRNILQDASQILKPHDLRYASVYKAAQTIFNGLGRAYYDERDAAEKRYFSAINKSFYDLDLNANSLLEVAERTRTSSTIGR